ncbi:hypothetical protein D3C71_1982490 [compost metagenome]
MNRPRFLDQLRLEFSGFAERPPSGGASVHTPPDIRPVLPDRTNRTVAQRRLPFDGHFYIGFQITSLVQPLATIGDDRLGKSFQSVMIAMDEDIGAAIFLEGLVRY